MSKILDEKIEKLPEKERELLSLRHTAEHVLHTAMQNLYPKLKKAMGPATDEGFYFDFDLDEKINETDFPKVEQEMQKLIDADLPMVKEISSVEKALEIFKDNPYKLEWVELINQRGEEISLYKMGEADLDLCSGPHLPSTGKIKSFKLLSVAGAYWHGDEKNKMLTRIYGTAFNTKKELDDYLEMLAEAEKRDHRKIGQELKLFVFSELVGKGLPLLTPQGTTIRRELERYTVDEELKRGYRHVVTPPLAKVDLYKTSGHYPYYKDTMYPPMTIDGEELILRPMTCPHHFMLYKSEPRSYRELPLRLAEISPQFRYEKSGELTGLMRVRMFCLADAHIFITVDQAKETIGEVLDLINEINSVLGLKKGEDYRFRLSLGDRDDDKKYYKDDAAWDLAEAALRLVLSERREPFFEAENEAAFYGPKIDVQVKNIRGKEETAFTVQYDFVMPKRFDLKYTAADGSEKQPVVIHRSSIGAFERTMAFLIEKYAGAFPVWLSPIQTKILPLSDKYLNYAKKVREEIVAFGGEASLILRVEIDDRNETLGAKIRDAQKMKIPYMLVVGEKEQTEGTVSVRLRNQKETAVKKTAEFADELISRIKKRALDL